MNKLLAGVLAVGICMGASAADTQDAQELSDEQKTAYGICNIVGEGVFSVAVMRQSDVKQSDAVKEVEVVSAELVKQFGDNEITEYIKEFWQVALTELYKQNVETSDDKKREFVQGATAEAGYACLDMILEESTEPTKTSAKNK
ncbi:hypothetical protein LU276_04205 [Moraxella haemolytica]|uniref:hypothetical protein n=1 Tax=Moraxella haemolytica TaxID=2904119 RepID=UPI002542EA98|nr:hypothetical protein [Moraxella sp. ZY171148]WII96023.1 hypothetical protein LU276_04205 [Moraxella sp. ZY171148]